MRNKGTVQSHVPQHKRSENIQKIIMTTISIIVAIDEENGIGKDNQLLCRLPNDMKRFKQLTTGHTIIMGKKTFDSLPKGALPNRKNIVISRNKSLMITNCNIVHSLNEAFAYCSSDEEVFIIGGASIYEQAYPFAKKLYLTRIQNTFEADTFFPEINPSEWEVESSEQHYADETHSSNYIFENLIRKEK